MKLCLALLTFAAVAAAADDLTAAARDLGRRTASAAGGGTVAVTWRNLSTLQPDEIAQARAAFEAAVRVTEGSEAQITVSENAASGLLIEEFRGQVWMAAFRRPPTNSSGGATVEKRLLWEQDEAILDAAQTSEGLLVLTPSGVWNTVTKQRARIVASKPWPRDLRGRMRVNGAAIEIELPGMKCSGTTTPELAVACAAADGTLAAGRNYFVRKGLPPFYASAAADQATILTLLDGTAGIFDASMNRAGSISGWGSDVAPAGARCGGGPVVLATRPGEGRDAIQAYEIVSRTARAVGEAAEFAGPVTALWPGVAVVRNGRYQAYAISLVCGR